jgi:hypothetical protein
MRYKAKLGGVCLFENENAEYENAPDHQGYFITHRDIRAQEKVEFAVWAGRPNSPRSFGGRISDSLTDPTVPSPEPLDLFGNPVAQPTKREKLVAVGRRAPVQGTSTTIGSSSRAKRADARILMESWKVV